MKEEEQWGNFTLLCLEITFLSRSWRVEGRTAPAEGRIHGNWYICQLCQLHWFKEAGQSIILKEKKRSSRKWLHFILLCIEMIRKDSQVSLGYNSKNGTHTKESRKGKHNIREFDYLPP